jgi:hypothetical protein
LAVGSAYGVREAIPILKAAVVQQILGRSTSRIWVFTVKVTDECIVKPDVQPTYVVAVYLKHWLIRMEERSVITASREKTMIISLYDDH